MKKILGLMAILVTAAVFSITAFAENSYNEGVKDEFVYALRQDGSAVIKDYYGSVNGELVIPSEIDGYTVTEIGSYCFEYESGLTSVTIPETVRIIGTGAFQYCYSLETISLPEGLETIGDGAFQSCLFIRQIDIPDSVTLLGLRTFKECTYLGEVTIGSGITRINDSTFENCGMLENVIIGENVKTIGSYAFSQANVRNIYIPKSIERIENNAFSGCYDMAVNYGGSQAEWDDISIRYGNDNLEEAKINYFMKPDGTVDEKAKSAGVVIVAVYAAIVLLLIIVVIVAITRKKNGVCSHCNAVIEDGSQFCGNCGTRL